MKEGEMPPNIALRKDTHVDDTKEETQHEYIHC